MKGNFVQNKDDTMEIIEAIRSRRSIRSFKSKPIPKVVLKELLDTCRWAPSGSNLQPWEFAILGGTVLEELKARLVKKAESEWDNSCLKYRNIYPDIPMVELPEPYLQRTIKLRAHIDTHQFPPGTKMVDVKRAVYRLYGARFYGAPNALIIYIEKALCPKYLFDIGVIAQTICLAAANYGLGTCIMGMVVYWPDIIRELIKITQSKAIVLGIAIGYPDTKAPVNTFKRTRETTNTFTQWYGF